ncbi:MAG: hypothetical protein U9Q89_05015 [Thermodesulfobacteriota bacterium]|nr:hypothetical protein [Thermodesulfobacteriota bacterium]
MLTTYIKIIGLIVVLSVFSGCRTLPQRETMLVRNWGTSLEATKQSQILNPEAGKNLDPVVGLDGQAAEASMEKYRKGFKEKQQAQTLEFTIGTK